MNPQNNLTISPLYKNLYTFYKTKWQGPQSE